MYNDFLYDQMKNDFLLVDSVESAIYCIKNYGVKMCKKYLKEEYLYLLEEIKC